MMMEIQCQNTGRDKIITKARQIEKTLSLKMREGEKEGTI